MVLWASPLRDPPKMNVRMAGDSRHHLMKDLRPPASGGQGVLMSEPVAIEGARIDAMLGELHAIGRRSTGTFRGLYSPAWREAQALIKAWMTDAGLEVRVDAVGSVW